MSDLVAPDDPSPVRLLLLLLLLLPMLVPSFWRRGRDLGKWVDEWKRRLPPREAAVDNSMHETERNVAKVKLCTRDRGKRGKEGTLNS